MDKLTTLMFDIVIAVVIAFVAVLIYFGLRSETVVSAIDNEMTDRFLSEIKEKGSMTSTDYESYMYQLSLTGVLYKVLFEHKFIIQEPEYRMRSIEEIIAAQKAAFTGENIYHYKDVITQIPEVTDPIDNSGLTMNTVTNESILAATVNSPSSGHVHTDDCYLGHKHKGSNTFTHSHAHTGTCYRYVSKISYQMSCQSCTKTYQWLTAIYYWHPTNGLTNSYLNTNGMNMCVYCNSTNMSIGTQINDNSYSCYYNIDENGDGLYDEVPNGVYKNYPGYSSPQSTARATYTSGCYTYHQAGSYRDQLTFSQYGGYVTNAGQALAALFSTNFQGYCILPTYVTRSYIYDGMTWMSLSYTPVVQGDGTVRFNYAGHRTYHNPWGGGSHTFPSGITVSQLYDIIYNLQSSFNRYVGESYNTSNGKEETVLSGESTSCSFDHALGVNKWIKTCGQEENATRVCPDKVISIVPTNAIQSVYTNEALISTVKATYQDGSTQIVLANTSFSTGAPILYKIVTLTYTDALGSSKTCTTTVNVVPRNIVCSNGHTYNLNTDGSDPGCIFCRAYVGNIRIIVPSVSTMTITIGSTLHENGLRLLVTYKDGHTETLTEGYEDNLDKQYLGTKMVKIGYKGAMTQILVTTVCAKLTCDICGFQYELYPDFTNPGCPKCISKTPVFTGNVLHYDSVKYTEEILETLYNDGIYRFNKNDLLAITVENRSSSLTRNLLRKIYSNMPEQWLHLESSETIRAK